MPRYSKKGRVSFDASAFGRLPLEIRASVYRHALTVPIPVRSRRFPFCRPQHRYPSGDRKDGLIWYNPKGLQVTTRPSKWFRMLLVCRQMYREAVQIWFQINCLEFLGCRTLIEMSVFNPVRFTYLKSLHIRQVDGDPGDLFKALARCTSLSSLEIRVFAWVGVMPNDGWLKMCAKPQVQWAVEQIRGLQHMEFLVSEWLENPRLSWQDKWVDKPLCVDEEWTQQDVDIANGMKAKMLRPKADAAATEMSAYCEKRKAELEDVNEEGDAKRRRIEW